MRAYMGFPTASDTVVASTTVLATPPRSLSVTETVTKISPRIYSVVGVCAQCTTKGIQAAKIAAAIWSGWVNMALCVPGTGIGSTLSRAANSPAGHCNARSHSLAR